MESDTFLRLTVNRILAVCDEIDYSQSDYHVKLVKEHHRRVALWTKALDCTDVKNWPFFDIAERMAPSIRVDEKIVQMVKKHLFLVNRFCEPLQSILLRSLHWAHLMDVDSDAIDFYELPDPFEPILLSL